MMKENRFGITFVCLFLIMGSLAANTNDTLAIPNSVFKDFSSLKTGDYAHRIIDKNGTAVLDDSWKNSIDKSKNSFTDCGLFTCEQKILISPSKKLLLDSDFIKGLASDPRITYDAPFYYDSRTVQRTRPIYKTVLMNYTEPANESNGEKERTVFYNATVQDGTETYFENETFENTDLTSISKPTTVILRAHKPSMGINVDLGYSILGQARTDAAWWNASYTYRFPVNCTLASSTTPIPINSSSGFAIDGKTQTVWTLCVGGNLSVYYNNYTDYVVANDTAQIPMDVDVGNGTNYQRETLWTSSGGVHAYHMNELTTLIDSAGVTNVSNVSTTVCTQGGSIGLGKSVFFNSDCAFGGNLYTGTATGTGNSTEIAIIKWDANHTNDVITSYGNKSASKMRGLWPASGASSYMFYFGHTSDFQSSITAPLGRLSVYFSRYNGTERNIGANTTYQGAAWTPNTGNAYFAIGYAAWDGWPNQALSDANITELQFYNRSLTDAEISTIYNAMAGTAGYGNLGELESSVNLTVNYTTGGTATGNNSTFIPPANLTINATASSGYYFQNWTTDCNGTFANASSPNTQIEILDATSCYAQANFLPYSNLTVTVSGSGTATGNNSTFIPPANLTINATASSGYYFQNWTTDCNGTFANASSPNTQIEILDATSCYAQANFLPYSNLTVTVSGSGTATGNNSSVAPPANLTINAIPATNWTFTNWTVTAGNCTVNDSTSTDATVEMTIPESCTVSALFTNIPQRNLTITCGTGGLSCTGTELNFYIPANKTITATANPSLYQFLNWSVESGNCTLGSSTTNNTTAIFTNTTGNCVVKANFVLIVIGVSYITYGNTSNITGVGSSLDYAAAVMETATGYDQTFGLMVMAVVFLGFYIVGSRYTQERALAYAVFMTTIAAFLLVSGNFLSPDWLILSIIALIIALYLSSRVG